MLVDGKWKGTWTPLTSTEEGGAFVRETSTFRNWVTPTGEAGRSGAGGFAAEGDRYHLYVALTCPWACRTLMARKLKGLEGAVSVAVVEPCLTEEGWRFGDTPGATPDVVNGATYLHEIYTRADPHFTGRATVPLLWDRRRETIVNNESADIVRMFNDGFGALANAAVDLYPRELRPEIDTLNDWLYEGLNNGVYRAGFATSQEAYEGAVRDVFATLDFLEARLLGRDFLVGDRLTESDLRAFVTLIRFDVAYYGLFKCNRAHVWDYPNLAAYTRRLYAHPALRETVDFDHIKRGYYSIKAVNPTGIVPAGPSLDWLTPPR